MRQRLFLGIELVPLPIFFYVVLSALVTASAVAPTEADSLYYHIPLAEHFLGGNFGQNGYGENVHMYFPAAGESLLAIVLVLGIPVGYFNCIGIVALCSLCYLLARGLELEKTESLSFAATVGSLYGVMRWVHAQTVDIWLAAFYVGALALLIKPKTSWWYFLNLGMLLGLLIGTKYSGPLFVIGLLLVAGHQSCHFFKNNRYFCQSTKNMIHLPSCSTRDLVLQTLQFMIMVLCILVIGGFWYVRNWVVTGNPLFPLDTPFFAGVTGNEIIKIPIWKAYLLYPRQMLDGAISEFMIWPVATGAMLAYLGYFWGIGMLQQLQVQHTTKKSQHWYTVAGIDEKSWKQVQLLLWLALWNFAVFLLLPSGDSMQLHVSQYRFAYVVIIPLIICFFILGKKVAVFSQFKPFAVLSNLMTTTPLLYRPKLWILFTLAMFYAWRLLAKKRVI